MSMETSSPGCGARGGDRLGGGTPDRALHHRECLTSRRPLCPAVDQRRDVDLSMRHLPRFYEFRLGEHLRADDAFPRQLRDLSLGESEQP